MMGSVFTSAFFFIVTLGILITFHEFGHYWVARRLGVKVLRFSVGFGKPLLSWRRGADQTEYVIAALPLGGYVKMLDEREGEVPAHELHRAFNRQSVGKRTAIVAAGPVFNFILAVAAYWLVFMIGITAMKPIIAEVVPGSPAAQAGFQEGDTIVSVAGEETPSWGQAIMAMVSKALSGETIAVQVAGKGGVNHQRQLDLATVSGDLNRGNLLDAVGIIPMRLHIPPLIGQLESGGAADRAGLQSGDLVVAANGEPVVDWGQFVELVRSRPGLVIQLRVVRDGQEVNLAIEPRAVDTRQGTIGKIGAGVQQPEGLLDEVTVVQKFGPVESIGHSLAKTWDVTVLTLRMLGMMVVGNVSLDNLSGPISIAQYAGDSAKIGLVPFMTFLAIVSISLGVLNLLPIPVLDGGHLMFYAVEFVKGSPVSAETEAMGQRIGVALILMLMVVAFYNDIVRIMG